ncbi:hypothetical protein KJ980_08285 [Patescibacteria group bacterium]|nr:hypothetical protein [Patescibacteria group bacterium]MBU4017378.1 hypothetical protein [Patescibacteria group bacterium]MBU4099613.1 hypothetical protein [Patescibacteria group bacterium]
MFDFFKGIIIFFTTITLPISGLFVHSKPVVKPTIVPTPTISISISPTLKRISPTPDKKIINTENSYQYDFVQNTPTTTPTSEIKYVITVTPVPLSSSNTTESIKTDPSIRIELCRTNAEQQKMNYIQAGDNLLVQERPQIAALANTSNNQETEDIALKYGLIKQSDIVRAADVYQKLINEGKPQDYAQSIAESTSNTWWTYLRSLHDWAVKEKNDYKATIETKANNSKNEYYTKCLSN